MGYNEVKYAVNSTIGTSDFKPLDQLINDNIANQNVQIQAMFDVVNPSIKSVTNTVTVAKDDSEYISLTVPMNRKDLKHLAFGVLSDTSATPTGNEPGRIWDEYIYTIYSQSIGSISSSNLNFPWVAKAIDRAKNLSINNTIANENLDDDYTDSNGVIITAETATSFTVRIKCVNSSSAYKKYAKYWVFYA